MLRKKDASFNSFLPCPEIYCDYPDIQIQYTLREIVYTRGASMKDYMSAREAPYKWGMSESRAHRLCQQGRIPGLEQLGRLWVILIDAEKYTAPVFERQQKNRQKNKNFVSD